MKTPIVYLFIIVMAFISCNTEVKQPKEIALKNAKLIHEDAIFIAITQNYIVFGDHAQNAEYSFKIYGRKSNEWIGNGIKLGAAPDELEQVFSLKNCNEHDAVYIVNNDFSIYKISLNELLTNKPTELKPIDTMDVGICIPDLVAENKKGNLVYGMSGDSLFYSNKQSYVHKSEIIPNFEEIDKIFGEYHRKIYIGNKPGGEKYFAAPLHYDAFSIYDSDFTQIAYTLLDKDTKPANFSKPNTYDDVITNRRPYATSNYIYVPFLGTPHSKQSDYGPGIIVHPRLIRVFNWEAKLVAKISTDEMLMSIAMDEENKRLYFINDIFELKYYDLEGITDFVWN